MVLRPLDPAGGHKRPKRGGELSRSEREVLRDQRNDTARRRPFTVRDVRRKK